MSRVARADAMHSSNSTTLADSIVRVAPSRLLSVINSYEAPVELQAIECRSPASYSPSSLLSKATCDSARTM